MITLPRTPTGRIFLAIALSVLLHMFLLFSPLITLPTGEVGLPPLTARLEPLPKAKPAPAPVEKRKPKPKIAPPKHTPGSHEVARSVSPESAQPEPPQAATPTIAEPPPPVIAEAAQDVQHAHPLPKHAQLTFTAYKGSGFPVGEVRYRLDIGDDGSYTITAGMKTTGILSLFKSFELNQLSSGTLTEQGLRPNLFSETRNSSTGREATSAQFNWAEQMLTFSSDHATPLPDQTQDILSFMFQLSQLPLEEVTLPIYISNGKKLGSYELLVGVEEEVETSLGKLRALPINKMNNPEDEGLTIWLGLEYRLLPVKIRQIDRNGEVTAELLISDIRLADE